MSITLSSLFEQVMLHTRGADSPDFILVSDLYDPLYELMLSTCLRASTVPTITERNGRSGFMFSGCVVAHDVNVRKGEVRFENIQHPYDGVLNGVWRPE